MKSKKQRILVFVILVELVTITIVSIASVMDSGYVLDMDYERYGKIAGFFNNSDIEEFVSEYKAEKIKELGLENEQNQISFNFSELHNKENLCIIKVDVYNIVENEYESDAVILDSDNIWISKTGEEYKMTIEK